MRYYYLLLIIFIALLVGVFIFLYKLGYGQAQRNFAANPFFPAPISFYDVNPSPFPIHEATQSGGLATESASSCK